MVFDVQAALKAGYSEGEIAEYLGQQQKFDAVAAMNSGYTPREIIKHLTTEPKAAPFSLTDVGLTGAAGAVGATRAVLQAFGPETPGVETLGEFQQSLLGMRTPERQAEVARRAALEEQAAKSGTPLEEIGAFLGGIKEAPIQSIAQGVGSTVPALLTGAAALVVGAPLGIAAAVGIGARFLFGALQGAGEVKGSIYDNVFRELKAQGIPEDQAKIQAEAAQDYIGKNTDNVFVGAGLGALAGGTGAERVLGNYVAKKIGVDLASGAAKKEAEGLIMRGVKEALKEGIPEGLQGGQEQFASNVALGREGIEMPEFQGVLGSAARDAAIGALTGGVVSPFGRQRAEAPVPEAQRPLEKLGPEQLTALRDQYVEAETELNRLAEAAKAPDLTPEQKTAAINAFIDYKNNTFAPLRAEFARYRTQIEALTPKPEVVTLPPEVPPTGEAPTPPVGRVEPPQRPIPPSEPSVDQPSGEPPRNTDEPPPVDEGPKSSEPPATPAEPLTGLPKPPETREFQIAKPKEQIAKEVQGMTIPELARWAVLNAPNTPAQQFALKAFERINQYADRGIFPGKINVMNAGKRNTSGVRGAVGYRYYTMGDRKPLVSSGFDISLRLNGLDEQGRADDLTGTRYSTILHELLHAATHLQIDLDPNSKPVKELNNLFKRVKAQVQVDIKNGVQNPALDAIRRGANTMKNVHELVSWGLTDKNFQDYLATIKVGEKTAFSKFVEIMRKLLNVNPEFESALDSLMRSSENLLSTPVKKIERGAGAPIKGAGIVSGEPAKRVALPKPPKPPKPPEGEEPPAPPPKPPEGEEPPAPGGIKLEPGKPFTRPKLPPLGPKPPELDISNVRLSKKPPEQGGRDPQVQAAAMLLAEGKMTREEYEKYVDHYRAIYPINIDALLLPSTVEAMRGALRGDVAKARLNTAIKDGTRVGLRMDLPALDKGVPVVSIHEGRPNADKKGRPYRSAGNVISYASTGYIKNVFFAPRDQDLSLKMGYMPEGKNPLQTAEGEWVNMTPEDVYKRVKELKNDPAWVQVGFDPHRHGYFYDRKTREPVAKADEMFQIGNFLLAKNVKYAPKEEFLYETAPVEEGQPPVLDTADIKPMKGRHPQVMAAARMLRDGKISREEFDKYVNFYKPIVAIEEGKLEPPPSVDTIKGKIDSNLQKFVGAPIEDGTKVGLRLDIKARDRGASVVTVHGGMAGKSNRGPLLSYLGTGYIKDVTFEPRSQARGLAVAAGGEKFPLQTSEGTWVNVPPEEVFKRVKQLMNDPKWTQVGFDPTRHGYFYDRKTKAPVVSASEMYQVGNFLLAKDVKYATAEEFLYETAERAPQIDTPAFKKWFGDSKIVDEDGNPLVVYHGTKREFNVFETKYPDGLFFFSVNPSFASKWPVGSGGKGDLREPPLGTEQEYNRIKKVEERLYSQYMKPSDDYDLNTKEGRDQFDLDRALLKAAVKKETGFSSAIEFEMNAGVRVMPVYLSIQKPFDPRKDFTKIEPFLAKAGKQKLIDAGYHKSGNWVIYEDKGVIDELKRQGYDGIWLAENVGGPHETIAAFSNKQIKSATGNIGTFGPTEVITEENVGTKAVDIINKLGTGVQPPGPSAFQRGKENIKNAFENPKMTVESARKATSGLLDKFETATFSSSAAFDNQLRRAVAGDIKDNAEVIGMLIDASQSQAVHADALASQFIIEGGIQYDPEVKKWVAYKEPDNFVELGKQTAALAKKYDISEDEARRIAHTYFMSKRLKSLVERNAKDKERIEELKAERSEATTKAEKEKINREIERLKDREAYIHKDEPEIELGLSLGEMMPELKEVAKTWNGIRNNVRRVMVNSGLWTEEYADQMLDVIDYVPFYREEQLEEGKGPKEFVRGLQVAAKEHRFKGTDKPVNDILDNMVRWTQYAVNRAVRNDKSVRMIDAALNIEMIDGTKMAERVTEAKRGMNIVRIWRDGEQELYNMADPLFAQAFTGIQSVAIEPMNVFSKFANTLRDSIVLFPLFSVAQVPQDSFAAVFSSGLQPQYALRIPILAVKEFIRTLSKTSQTHEMLKKYGAVGVRDFNSTVIRDDAEIFAGLKAPPGVKGQVKEMLQHIAMSADNAVRQAVYEASIQQGLSKAEAMEKAFEIINFRRRGTNKMLQLAGQTIPFFYAYLAAQRVAYNTLTGTGISPQDRSAALKTFAYTTASVMTLSLLYSMMNADDEDYKKTPAAIRDRMLMIPGAGGVGIPLRTDMFLFPKIIAEHTYLLLTQKGYEDPAKFRKSMASALGDALLSPTLVPQAIKPAVEMALNYDFFQQRPILGQFEKQKEWSRQFNENTSELSKLFGKTGYVSPIMMDHFVRGFFGTTGGLALWFTNEAINKSNLLGVQPPEKTWREAVEAFPGTGSFLVKSNASALRTDFYDLRDRVNEAAATFSDIKQRNPDAIKEFVEDEKRMAKLVVSKQVENVNKRLAQLRTQMDRIREIPSDRMSGAEKAEAIRNLKEVEETILKAINVPGMRERAKI